MNRYPLDQLLGEVAFVAFHFHWAEREIMELVLAGHPSKNISADLGISQRTVENHRAGIMKRTGSKSLPALARLALLATGRAMQPSIP